MKSAAERTVVIISITSDIGIALAKRYAKDGYAIIGTYRSTKLLRQLDGIKNCRLFYCDISDKKSISRFIGEFKKLGLVWDVFISCPCNPLPVKSFFDCEFDEWSDSVHVNSIEQLRLLHEIYRFRNKDKISDVIFFAGGGVNGAVMKFSAYTISKIMLVKMCEFLDHENKDLNIFIVGPGWAKTKAHDLVLKHVSWDDERRQKTIDFLKSGKGTTMDDIYGCIRWLCGQGKKVSSGRNFSIVHDAWKGPLGKKLVEELKKDVNMYKLRRYKNELLASSEKSGVR